MKRDVSTFRRRGAVLLIVLITLVFATTALVMFIEKADTDLLVDIRTADAIHLRLEAYSALDTSIAVLDDFYTVGKGLHSPAEGWGDPLGFASYAPVEVGDTVTVTVEDESAKLPLYSVKSPVLIDLFKYWNLTQDQAQSLTDALLLWMNKSYVATAVDAPAASYYEGLTPPFDPPLRPLRSFDELKSIGGGVQQAFFDDQGNPTPLYQHFVDTFSLYRYKTPNINGNKLEPLLAQQLYDDQQQQRVTEYLTGTGTYQTQGPGYFKSTKDIGAVAGGQPTKIGYGTTVSALRITVTVYHGRASFVLTAVVAPPNGATAVPPSNVNTITTTATDSSGSSTTSTADGAAQAATGQSATIPTEVPAPAELNYPFTFLELRENDQPVPPPAPTTSSAATSAPAPATAES